MFTEVLLIIVTNCEQPKYPSGVNGLKLHRFCTIEHLKKKNMVDISVLLLKTFRIKEISNFQKSEQCILVCACFSENTNIC